MPIHLHFTLRTVPLSPRREGKTKQARIVHVKNSTQNAHKKKEGRQLTETLEHPQCQTTTLKNLGRSTAVFHTTGGSQWLTGGYSGVFQGLPIVRDRSSCATYPDRLLCAIVHPRGARLASRSTAVKWDYSIQDTHIHIHLHLHLHTHTHCCMQALTAVHKYFKSIKYHKPSPAALPPRKSWRSARPCFSRT